MFQFRRFPTYAYLIQRRLTEYCSAGFPHSVIPGSTLMCSSPRLIAACHDLLRLLMPRHSPCALFSLTSSALVSARHGQRILVLSELCRHQQKFLLGSLFYPISQVTQLALPSVACSQYFFLHRSVFKVPAFRPLSRPDRNPHPREHFDLPSTRTVKKWWAQVDSNHRPHDYQSCALAS